jgi:pimeloyl-ACP methyl ester carboxylesterase
VILLSGGEYGDAGPFMYPPDQHADYANFLNAITANGWKVIIPYGRRDLGDWYNQLIHEYDKPDIILGHSEGGFLGMLLAEDNPKAFSKYLIFNVPLIYPSTYGWKECYSRASNITDNVTIIMSEQDTKLQDNGIMGWSMNGFSMDDAIKSITSLERPNIILDVLDVDGYEHSPFSNNIALDKFNEVTGSNT